MAKAGYPRSHRGLVHLAAGAHGAAGAALERGAEIGVALPSPRLESEVLARRARRHAALAEWSAAQRCVERATAIAEPLGLGVELREARLVEAEVWLAQDDLARAGEALARLPERPTGAERALRERVTRGWRVV
ncbi:MAG: hypothetical protein Q8P18_18230 [Pseudomonadota bacterium]|nr:hypothetical protein [Pseudomonadota bacterium]